MLKSRFLLALFAVTAPFCLKGDDSWVQDWNFKGTFLYFQPTVDDTYFVGIREEPAEALSGKRKNNCLSFEPGFRLELDYTPCWISGYFYAEYSRVFSDSSKFVKGDQLVATVGVPDQLFYNYDGSAKSHLEHEYQNGYLAYSRKIFNCCGLGVSLIGGLEAVEIDRKENDQFLDDADSIQVRRLVSWDSGIEGIGPHAGFAASCDLPFLCSGLAATFESSASLLGASNHSKLYISDKDLGEIDNDILVDISDKRTWRVIPALHLRTGLNYSFCLSCFRANLEIGYEISSYLRALSRPLYVDNTARFLASTEYDSFGIHGMYITLGACF